MTKILKTRYIVHKVSNVVIAGTKVTKFSIKIPKDFVLITGYRATIRKPSVGAIPSATISISFNSKASNPVVADVEKHNAIAVKRKIDFLSLAEQVQDGTYITGYIEVRDNIWVGQCYVKITFRGKKIFKTD